ncbi:hypothetical protein FRB94_011188 [Tulasnella sp. JGI-2019a]|nr:hypothetical protein FRB93_006380 [Tulasnella sp. JGI-2019a]KAG8992913.1 hypothetical protein FRB94_011188 [Tulasnella sp. JGI-2019a]
MGRFAHKINASTCGLLSLSMFCRSLEHLLISVSDPPVFHGRTPSDPRNRAYKLRSLRFYQLVIGDETSEEFVDWPAVFYPKVHHLEVDFLSLDRHSSISKEEIDLFVENVFETRKMQPLESVSLSTDVPPQ